MVYPVDATVPQCFWHRLLSHHQFLQFSSFGYLELGNRVFIFLELFGIFRIILIIFFEFLEVISMTDPWLGVDIFTRCCSINLLVKFVNI